MLFCVRKFGFNNISLVSTVAIFVLFVSHQSKEINNYCKRFSFTSGWLRNSSINYENDMDYAKEFNRSLLSEDQS